MILLLLAGALALVVLAGFQIRSIMRGLVSLRRVVSLDITPIGSLTEGPCEVAGTIVALAEPVVAPSGRACAFADVSVTATRGSGKQSRTLLTTHEQRTVETVVRDATGDAKLTFEFTEIAAPRRVTPWAAITGPLERSWCPLVPPTTDSLVFAERVVEVGAQVVLTGRARIVASTIEARTDGAEGYRDGVPVEKKTFVIGGDEDARLLVANGSKAALLWRASWPIAVLVTTATLALAYVALIVAVMVA